MQMLNSSQRFDGDMYANKMESVTYSSRPNNVAILCQGAPCHVPKQKQKNNNFQKNTMCHKRLRVKML